MSVKQIRTLIEAIDSVKQKQPKKSNTLYGISVYYGGGYQSFDSTLVLSVNYNGLITLRELSDMTSDFPSQALITQLRATNPAVYHEVSDSIYAVGSNKVKTINALVEELTFNQKANAVDFAQFLSNGETGDVEYDDGEGDEES